MQRSMSDIISDLTQKDEESEVSEGSDLSLCVICFEERVLEILPCSHTFCKQVWLHFTFYLF